MRGTMALAERGEISTRLLRPLPGPDIFFSRHEVDDLPRTCDDCRGTGKLHTFSSVLRCTPAYRDPFDGRPVELRIGIIDDPSQ